MSRSFSMKISFPGMQDMSLIQMFSASNFNNKNLFLLTYSFLVIYPKWVFVIVLFGTVNLFCIATVLSWMLWFVYVIRDVLIGICCNLGNLNPNVLDNSLSCNRFPDIRHWNPQYYSIEIMLFVTPEGIQKKMTDK